MSPVAASRGSAQSRYHGWTTGPSATIVSSTSAAPRTGDRPSGRSTRNSAIAAPASIATPRKKVTAPSTVPSPIQSRTLPTTIPAAVGGDSQVRTVPGVLREATQPRPTPTASDSAAKTSRTIADARAHAQIRCGQVARVPAQIRPAKGSTTRAIGLTPPARPISTTPMTGCRSTARVRPATIRPTIRASLCAPATKCIRTRGFSRASQTALGGSMPWAYARRGR